MSDGERDWPKATSEDAPHGKPFDEESSNIVDFMVGTTWALRHLIAAIRALDQALPDLDDQTRAQLAGHLGKAEEWNERPLHFPDDDEEDQEQPG